MFIRYGLCALFNVVLTLTVAANDVGFVEDFALSDERAKVLQQLIPGTEDHYFYHCLHEQNKGELDKVEELLKLWQQRHGRTQRVEEIINRQALLGYEKDSKKSLDFLRWRLGLNFGHCREILDQKPTHPTKLDPTLISRKSLTQSALNHYGNLQGFEDTALEFLPEQNLNADQRRELLSRLQRPDVPNLPKLLVDDLKHQHSGGFGSLPIHCQLLLTQLDECLKLMPELLLQTAFVNAYLSKLQPNPDVDVEHDVREREAYLERLWSFAQRLAPAHNSLKAHILYHRLRSDSSQDIHDKGRFMEYLKLPRQMVYVNQDYLNRDEFQNSRVDLSASFKDTTIYPPVGGDELLVRDFLMHLFLKEDSFAPYAIYIRDDYLKDVFAETKIVNGIGDMEKWYSLLNNPEKYQRLKERVDLDFVPMNKKYFRGEDAVSLELDVKNVKTLIVKVYEINALNYYREQKREVDSAINLDGLVANEESTYTYEEPPLRRVRRHFDFPSLKKPGVYVVDFIGNGMSSRVLIHKGHLRFLERTGAAGHIFTVLNEDNVPVKDAVLWLSGHEYKAGGTGGTSGTGGPPVGTPSPEGEILVPFSSNPGKQPIILSGGERITFDSFEHKAETYTLKSGMYVDREALLKQRKAKVLVRPILTLSGIPITVSLLEEVSLRILSTDRDGIQTSKDISDFKLFDDKESIYEFQVPENILELTFFLYAKVKSLSEIKKIELSAASASFRLNQVDTTEKVECLLLGRSDAGYTLQLLGKNGETRSDRAVRISLKHQDFRESVQVALQTDAEGRVMLGTLPQIVRVEAALQDGQNFAWPLDKDNHTYPTSLHGKADDTLKVPVMIPDKKLLRDSFSLLEKRGTGKGTYVKDWIEKLSLADGFLQLEALPAGDYELFLKEIQHCIAVRVTAGVALHDFVLSENRLLEVINPEPLQIATVEIAADTVKIHLKYSGKSTRVHVAAARYMPAYSLFNGLNPMLYPEPECVTLSNAQAVYLTGRNIGDEYRYILDRRYAVKFSGNMLKRAGLLLNPWALDPTLIDMDSGEGQGSFGSRGGGGRKLMVKRHCGSKNVESSTGTWPNLDFLPEGSVLLSNLIPDKDGIVTLSRKDLGQHQHIRILAVDIENIAYREAVFPETPLKPLDLRLSTSLDSTRHFTEQKHVSVVEVDQALVLNDIGVSNVEVFDTLQKVYALYSTLSKDAQLAEFSFILNWPGLKDEEKRTNYSKYACHELHFFLYKKDPGFFKAVVLPYLRNKKDKTFMDHFLVEDDLAEYLKPWAHARLNIVEKILLGQRMEAERAAAARHVKDVFDLISPDSERFNYLFRTALQGSALESGAGIFKDVAEDRTTFNPQGPTAAPQSELANGMVAKDGIPAARSVDAPPAPIVAEVEKLNKEAEAALQSLAQISGDRYEEYAADKKNNNKKLIDMDLRQVAKQFYRKLEKTEELAENNYYHLLIKKNTERVTANAFWNDYAAKGNRTPFVSSHFAEASHNFTEMLLALAVMDLPFEAGKHETELKGSRMTLKAKSALVAFHKELMETAAPGSAEKVPVLVSQNLFRHGDRYRYENNERFDKYVTDEFLVHTVYGCQVVLTNPTSSPQKLDLLLQIPRGALPVLNGFYTKGIYVQLQPYSTTTHEYHFYFPEAGEFTHYPLHVAQNGKMIASVPAKPLNVVKKLTRMDTESWDYLSQNGSGEQVVAFLQANNLQRVNLERIAWRMQESAYFKSILDLLARRHVYNQTLWSYGIQHDDATSIREFLTHNDSFVSQCGRWLDTKLLSIDPTLRGTYQHLEYSPLVNARTHPLGKQRKILNERFCQQYLGLLDILKYKPNLDDSDRLAIAYYLLLQDRIEEGLAFFKRVVPANIPTKLQYDYVRAYVDFYSDNPKQAREIAQRYSDYPVDRWRNVFADVCNQLDEAEGKGAKAIDPEDRGQVMGKLAASEPAFEFKVESKKVLVSYQNLSGCEVNYYPMDIELLFSSNPFVREVTGQFAFVRPLKTETRKFQENNKTFEFELPKEFHSSNVMVELVAGGIRNAQAYYSHALSVQLFENYGQIQVTAGERAEGGAQKSGQPLPKVYVKVYAKLKSGESRFYKDGYTDLRGRFDYASLSTDELEGVDKFAFLVLSETDGAVIREAQPPKR